LRGSTPENNEHDDADREHRDADRPSGGATVGPVTQHGRVAARRDPESEESMVVWDERSRRAVTVNFHPGHAVTEVATSGQTSGPTRAYYTRPMSGFRRRSLGIGVLLLSLAACRRAPLAAPLRPPPAPGRPQVLVDSERVRREGVAVPAVFEWLLPENAGGQLRLAWTSTERRGDVTLVAELVAAGRDPARLVGRATRKFPEGVGAGVFFDEDWRIPASGRTSRLRLRLEPAGAFFLSDTRVVRPDSRSDAVLLLLFDTTRRDALGLYGCPDPSSPNLDAIFRGAWKAERAYAPASWTIPSVASLLTGRVPAVEEGADGAPRGILPGITTIATDFRAAGRSTAAFVANPTLHDRNGFAEGFTTFFTTPYELASITMPGAETVRRAPKWLAAHRGEPYLLFVLLMDPHDPYTPPDRPRGSTPMDPGYRGTFTGDEIQRLQIGQLPRPSDRDIRHLQALYHDEVRYADSKIGELWNGLDAAERDRATVIFTSDHGEEFDEHGGWKHGPALFDEVLRVPLLIRPRAGKPAPAAPADALVSLLDVLPTVEALAGLPPPGRTLDGRNLLETAARERASLPAVTMLTGGGARAAVVDRAAKLVFFDRLGTRGIPDAAKDPDGWLLARRLPDRLPALGRFDLAVDPGETKLLGIDEKTFPAQWRAVEQAIAGTREGFELRFLGGANAPRLRIVVDGFPAADTVEPFALDAADTFTWRPSPTGHALTAALDIAGDVDGFLVSGPSSDLKMTVESEGCVELTLGETRMLASGRVETIPQAAVREALPRFERHAGCAGVFVWRSPRGGLAPAEGDEAVRKLRALGYLH
jgi:arylsulfatase A-like enzyme